MVVVGVGVIVDLIPRRSSPQTGGGARGPGGGCFRAPTREKGRSEADRGGFDGRLVVVLVVVMLDVEQAVFRGVLGGRGGAGDAGGRRAMAARRSGGILRYRRLLAAAMGRAYVCGRRDSTLPRGVGVAPGTLPSPRPASPAPDPGFTSPQLPLQPGSSSLSCPGPAVALVRSRSPLSPPALSPVPLWSPRQRVVHTRSCASICWVWLRRLGVSVTAGIKLTPPIRGSAFLDCV